MKKRPSIPPLAALAALFFVVGASTVFAAPPPSSAGPDGFGYEYTDSRHPGGPQYNFIDIKSTGTRMTGQNGANPTDDDFQGVDLGFEFTFYDQEYTFCFVTTNGFITFGAGSTSYGTTPTIPSGINPDNLIAGYWSDLDPAQGGNIYFQTIGAAPNRRFVVQYEEVKQHAREPRATFQIHLLEGSNQIEMHYEKIDDYTTEIAIKFGIGIENINGNTGLGYLVRPHTTAGHADKPARPFAIRYTRPVVVEVESEFGGNKVTPNAGIYKRDFESVQTFEAPEFIYLNQNLSELTGPDSGPYSGADNIAWYRARNVGYAIDGEVVQGVERFFERTVTADMKVIWKWELEYAVVIESATGDGGYGNPSPGIGRVWVKGDTDFTAAIDSAVESEGAGFRFQIKGYKRTELTPFGNIHHMTTLDPQGVRSVTDPIIVNGPQRIEWLWSGQVRYRFDAIGGGGVPFADQAFVQVNGGALQKAGGFNRDVWVDTDASVTVGSFYRTGDDCSTLVDFPGALGGDLTGLGSDVSNFGDAVLEGAVARTFTVPAAKLPTEIHWLYGPTVYRAEVPLGRAFDPSRTVPPLCGSNPVLHDAGPTEGFIIPVGETPSGDGSGNPLRWDQVGQKLYPVEPGSHQIQWRDQNLPGTTYQIEIVSDYPGEPAGLASERENPDGWRQGSAPGYVLETPPLTGVSVDFPASPSAHYLHLADPVVGRRPPTKLDLSATDEWAFQELTYSDKVTKAAVDGAVAGTGFSAVGEGRSVLLYSYRPNSDEVADGNLDEEALAVRVIGSSLIEPIERGNEAFVLGQRGLELSGAPTGLVERGGGTKASLDPGNDFVIDFWFNGKGVQAEDGAVQILSTGEGKFSVTLDPATSTLTTSYLGVDVAHAYERAGSTWRHCVVHVFSDQFFGVGVTIVDFYVDGVREEQGVVTAGIMPAMPASSVVGSGVDEFSLRFGVGANPRRGLQLDRFRLFSFAPASGLWLTPQELRGLRRGSSSTARLLNPELAFEFEEAPTGGSFANGGSIVDVGIGPAVDADGVFDETWAHVGLQEVATPLGSTLDEAGFGGSGFILNAVSNYNANLYARDAEVGEWGPVYPVNHEQLYVGDDRRLEVAYYENPYRVDSELHPNVAWPYVATAYNDVIYPTFGPHADKRIYIASRVGSEGVDWRGRPQPIYKLGAYANLEIYNQPSLGQAGFNPNEEHALVAPSARAGLKIKNAGDDIANNPPLAAFALQKDINATLRPYTSDPWVLVQVDNLVTGEPEMAAYRVGTVRPGLLPFPRPSDGDVAKTEGLAYEGAANREDRFLTIDPEQTYDFSYAFAYPVFAGDLLIPPYPLNLVVGNVAMTDDRGKNGEPQRTFWRDVNGAGWVVSGDGGQFAHQFHYPFRNDFYLPGTAPGNPVPWVPKDDGSGRKFSVDGEVSSACDVIYTSFWRSDYPKLKRGETLTYQGGEYFNETPGANGLPALVAMKAAKIVFDVATPTMIIGEDNVGDYSARVIRPLDRHESRFMVSEMAAAGFSPKEKAKIFVVAERWYFEELAGSLQRRFYFDSLAEKLVFRGYLNDKDSGDPDLTAGPDPINIVEPNVLTAEELVLVKRIGEGTSWGKAVDAIFEKSQNPMRIRDETPPEFPAVEGSYLAGMRESPIVEKRIGLNLELFNAEADQTAEEERIEKAAAKLKEIETRYEILKKEKYQLENGQTAGGLTYGIDIERLRYKIEGVESEQSATAAESAAAEAAAAEIEANISELGFKLTALPTQEESRFVHLDSFGVGSALVSNPNLLTAPIDGSRYITIAENDDEEVDGPVSLHIVEIIPDRYRGAVKVIEAANAFSEKVMLQHNADFGANTGDLYYEWWIRDAAPLDVVADEVLDDGTLEEVDDLGNSLWQQYLPKSRIEDDELNESEKHLGLHSIVFEGRPDVTLADKLVLMRYRHRDEDGWNLVPFEVADAAAAWKPGRISPIGDAPFQWAGAANSPQLQADGSKQYVPQLVMGWVKRILDRINPYEARYNDFFGNESPAAYSSQIQIAGAPYAGKVALNPDKNVIENTGLIELYETVLARARELSIDSSSNPVATDGINQALLLAATRLAVLYELLAQEAYSDAQDSTITVTDADDLSSVASYTHAFQNLEADLLHEELALLRGTDFVKSYPVDNRLFWNYAKGLGEAAYNVNYRIYDENLDGFINEDDARALYPQGHGDSWGHYLRALGMHYELLQQPVFSWKTRSELYSLMQNVLEVDFLDEKTFAKLAAGKARAGRDIVRATYRVNYTQEPDGQWQGYTDGAAPARAWGVSEWAHRAGQGAYFDWAVANAILPEDAGAVTPVNNPENLDRIERLGAIDEIGEVAGGLYEIQLAMDEANGGVNPLGFDADSIAFDIDPYRVDGQELERDTHFDQIYERAIDAGSNALATLDFAAKAGNKLARLAGDTDALIVEAFRQDLDFRNRLIEIFGSPYDGTIGFGEIYPEGYEGPDTQLFSYLDRTTILQIIPESEKDPPPGHLTFKSLEARALNVADDKEIRKLYADIFQKYFFDNLGAVFTTPFGETLGIGESELYEAFITLEASRSYDDFTETVGETEIPIRQRSAYAFQAPEDGSWGQRTSYGTLQRILEEELRERIALDQAINVYVGFLQDFEVKTNRLESELSLVRQRNLLHAEAKTLQLGLTIVKKIKEAASDTALQIGNAIQRDAVAAAESLPHVVGLSNDPSSAARGAFLFAASKAQIPTQTGSKIAKYLKIAAIELTKLQIGELEFDGEQTADIANLEGLVVDLVGLSGNQAPMRDTIAIHLQNIELKRQEYLSAQAEGFRLLREREGFNKILAAKVQKNRYQDMFFRIARNEAMTKHQSAFNHAARYAWLAAKAYDYETSLDPGDPAAPGALLDQIVKARQLGLWVDGQPQAGQGGLAEILHHLAANFQVLEGQLGINNPQSEFEKISLRRELFRIRTLSPDVQEALALHADDRTAGQAQLITDHQVAIDTIGSSDDRWEDALKARIVPDLNAMPEFVRYCRPFATAEEGVQPGIVIRFGSQINNGLNFFGLQLAGGDHSYSTANFATKVRGFGVWLENYNAAGLSTTPRAYMVPVGTDYLRTSGSSESKTRAFPVLEQRIPTPFVINEANLLEPGFIPTLNGVDGGFAELRRHGDFRMYHDSGAIEESELILDSRLISRSVWNSEWLLIIPGAGLHVDPDEGLKQLAETIGDIKLHFKTYSHQGQ